MNQSIIQFANMNKLIIILSMVVSINSIPLFTSPIESINDSNIIHYVLKYDRESVTFNCNYPFNTNETRIKWVFDKGNINFNNTTNKSDAEYYNVQRILDKGKLNLTIYSARWWYDSGTYRCTDGNDQVFSTHVLSVILPETYKLNRTYSNSFKVIRTNNTVPKLKCTINFERYNIFYTMYLWWYKSLNDTSYSLIARDGNITKKYLNDFDYELNLNSLIIRNREKIGDYVCVVSTRKFGSFTIPYFITNYMYPRQ